MDTYWSTNGNCVKCGRCVKVCNEKGYGELYGGRDKSPDTCNDNLCCHHCKQYCKDVCHYNAIEISRW